MTYSSKKSSPANVSASTAVHRSNPNELESLLGILEEASVVVQAHSRRDFFKRMSEEELGNHTIAVTHLYDNIDQLLLEMYAEMKRRVRLDPAKYASKLNESRIS